MAIIPSPQAQTRIAMALGYELGDLLDEMMDSVDWSAHEDAIEEEMKPCERYPLDTDVTLLEMKGK